LPWAPDDDRGRCSKSPEFLFVFNFFERFAFGVRGDSVKDETIEVKLEESDESDEDEKLEARDEKEGAEDEDFGGADEASTDFEVDVELPVIQGCFIMPLKVMRLRGWGCNILSIKSLASLETLCPRRPRFPDRIFFKTSNSFDAVNAFLPESIKYNTQPQDQISTSGPA